MVAALRHTDHRAWLALARSLMATGLPPAACTGYRAALQLAPSGEIWAELARAELAAGDKQAAAEAVAEGRALIGGCQGRKRRSGPRARLSGGALGQGGIAWATRSPAAEVPAPTTPSLPGAGTAGASDAAGKTGKTKAAAKTGRAKAKAPAPPAPPPLAPGKTSPSIDEKLGPLLRYTSDALESGEGLDARRAARAHRVAPHQDPRCPGGARPARH